MNFDFIIDKFFKTKLVKGIPNCPDCPPDPCNPWTPCCDDTAPDPGPCGCSGCSSDGGGNGPNGNPPGGFGAPGGEVDTQEVENFLMAVGQLAGGSNGGQNMDMSEWDSEGGGDCPCQNCSATLTPGYLPYVPPDPNFPSVTPHFNGVEPIPIPILNCTTDWNIFGEGGLFGPGGPMSNLGSAP
jgi:hypothetical protein